MNSDYDNFWNVLFAGVIAVVFVGVLYLAGCRPAPDSRLGEYLKTREAAKSSRGFNVTFNDGSTAFYPGDVCYPEGSYIIIRKDSMAPATEPRTILGNVAKVEEVRP